MAKRKLQIGIFAAFVLTFVGVQTSTFLSPAPVNVNVRFDGFQPTNTSFYISNAGPSQARLTFLSYHFSDKESDMFIRPSGLGVLCMLKPGQSTNLALPKVPPLYGLGIGRDCRWRVEFTSKRDWLAKLEGQPKWLQNVVTKAMPRRWLAGLHQADIESAWITNAVSTSQFQPENDTMR